MTCKIKSCPTSCKKDSGCLTSSLLVFILSGASSFFSSASRVLICGMLAPLDYYLTISEGMWQFLAGRADGCFVPVCGIPQARPRGDACPPCWRSGPPPGELRAPRFAPPALPGLCAASGVAFAAPSLVRTHPPLPRDTLQEWNYK